MDHRETLPSRGISRKDMMKRVARFGKLKGSDGGLPDSRMPGCERILYNAIGGNAPGSEFTTDSMRRIEAAGALPGRAMRKGGRRKAEGGR